MPAGWEDVLERCPVDGPRTFGDGFGAPRYAGGYHLHKGVDILSPSGTPIVAPFDGYARSDYNSLGGNVVFVEGRYGTVYNAHLSAYSSNSERPGAGRRRDRLRGRHGRRHRASTHDHFEFHPNVMPSELAVERLRLLDHRGRDQPVPAARGRLRLSPANAPAQARRLRSSRPMPISIAHPASTSSTIASVVRPDSDVGSRRRGTRAHPPPSRCRTRGRWLRTAAERSNPCCRAVCHVCPSGLKSISWLFECSVVVDGIDEDHVERLLDLA